LDIVKKILQSIYGHLIKEKKKGMTDETPGQLQNFIGEVKKGKITPAQEK
jgi:hypothetical protein